MTSTTLLESLRDQRPAMVDLLARLVNLESPSFDKPLLDRLAGELAEAAALFGLDAEVVPQPAAGNHLLLRTRAASGGEGQPILLIGHYDTVFAAGTVESRPFRLDGDKARGPGVLDMKSGLVQALFALRAIAPELGRPVTLLINSDEEIGSLSSRELIEEQARLAARVLVLEPAGSGGALKTARKGVGIFHLDIIGRASHAGSSHERGRSALAELAHQVLYLQGLTDYARGITLNVGVAQGGTRANVVPEFATAEVDLRVATVEDGQRLEETILGLPARTEGCAVTVMGGMNRPPMQRTEATAALLEQAQAAARRLGFEVGEEAVGGGSDGNFTAALGIPTLDGLGSRGDGAHQSEEYVWVESLPERAALLAQLLLML
ncbi:MAG: M20 family metallopeptidase [Chloroflexota bacterium]